MSTTTPSIAARATRQDAWCPGARLVLALLAAAVAACAPRTGVPAVGTPAAVRSAAPASLAAAPDQFFQAGAARLRYREAGRGEAVVFLHGFLGRMESWTSRGVPDSLARDHRVIVLDERGFGASSRFETPAAYGLAMAHDVIRLLDHLQLRRAHLVGHSMGAVVAANVAACYPDRVLSAALVAPPEYADSSDWARATAGWVADLERGAGVAGFLRWLFPRWTAETAAQRGRAGRAHARVAGRRPPRDGRPHGARVAGRVGARPGGRHDGHGRPAARTGA